MSGKIGTHNGKFHCDEALACFLLKRLDSFKDHSVVRSRDPAVLKECDVVVDVGGVFDHESKRYDHHQREFTHTMQTLGILDFNTKLSSAGLVYAHYGKQIIAKILGLEESDRIVTIFYRKLYESFVEEIDAVDNGISQYDGVPRYRTSGGISGRVGQLNLDWNEEGGNADERFQQAMELVGGEFVNKVQWMYRVWWPARKLVEEAITKRKEVDPTGRILVLENGGVPWKEHFFTIEEELGLKEQKMTYICFSDSTANQYRVQAIPTNSMAAFENRMPLPKAWRSLRDDALSEVSGIPGGVFVHTSGFIGGNKTREGAIAMARKAIEIGEAEAAKCAEMETESKKMKLDDSVAENGNGVTASA